MRMSASLVFDEPRLAAEEAVASELDLTQPLRKARQHLEQREEGALGEPSTVAHRLPQHLRRVDQPGRPAPRSKYQPNREAGQGQPHSPYPRAACLPDPMALGRRAMQKRPLRECVATS